MILAMARAFDEAVRSLVQSHSQDGVVRAQESATTTKPALVRFRIVCPMSFSDHVSVRSADTYADFLMPHLEEDSLVLDCGTAEGAIAVGIASRVPKG